VIDARPSSASSRCCRPTPTPWLRPCHAVRDVASSPVAVFSHSAAPPGLSPRLCAGRRWGALFRPFGGRKTIALQLARVPRGGWLQRRSGAHRAGALQPRVQRLEFPAGWFRERCTWTSTKARWPRIRRSTCSVLDTGSACAIPYKQRIFDPFSITQAARVGDRRGVAWACISCRNVFRADAGGLDVTDSPVVGSCPSPARFR